MGAPPSAAAAVEGRSPYWSNLIACETFSQRHDTDRGREMAMPENNVVGWVFESAAGSRWAVQADTKEDALNLLTSTAPADLEVIDERTIPAGDAAQYELEAGKAVLQKQKGDGRK
jgi:hypothetical protein